MSLEPKGSSYPVTDTTPFGTRTFTGSGLGTLHPLRSNFYRDSDASRLDLYSSRGAHWVPGSR